MADSGHQQQQSPVQVVEAYLQAWNDRSGQAVVQTLADGGTYVDPTLPGPVAGDDLKGYVDALVEAFPDINFENEGIMAAGDRVVLQWRMTGTNTGPLPGMPAPTGGTSNLPGIDVITVGPAGIISVVGYFDQLTFLGQLGVEVQVGPPNG
jgi:steroid delta-isomerase-like uncharacterized protein